MKLDDRTLYVKEKEDGYVICIDMPDSSRNYLHSDIIKNLWQVQECLNDLKGLELNGIDVEKDGTYYRLSTAITVSDSEPIDLHFHSRKMNLNDAFYERSLIINVHKCKKNQRITGRPRYNGCRFSTIRS